MLKDFPWRRIGGYTSNNPLDIKKNSVDKSTSDSLHDESVRVQNFVIDKFFSDLYWNTAIMIGTCFFSWIMGRIGGGIFALMFVFLCTTSVYRAEFRRFNRDLRDDMTRVAALARLDNTAETMEWLNSFLLKFWVIYMPALSDMVMTQANQVLAGAAPGFGIDDLSLDQFTLGSKAPTVDAIKSYTRKGKDVVEMDWAFSFAPNQTDNMTKNELKKKIDPKVALGVRVGKGFVSKNLPILVEDMQFIGRMRVTLKLSLNFPHIKVVSISFLEPPQIEYGLKPVGGDTLGLDIMSLIPGLSSFVNSLIHSNLGPMLYAPNSLDIDVEEIMAAQGNDAIGVLAVTLQSADVKDTIDPFIELHSSTNPEKKHRSSVKKNTKTPRWNETQYVLVNNLQQQLMIDLWDFNDHTKNKLIGSSSFDLQELLQKETFDNIDTSLKLSGKNKGHLRYSLKWFPVLEGEELEDGTKSAPPESEVGILKFTVHDAKGIDTSASKIGELSPYAEVYIDGKMVKKLRTLKRTNEPAWGEEVETLIKSKSATKVKILIKDQSSFGSDPIVATYSGDLQSVIFQILDGDDIFKLSPQGGLRLSAQWSPVALTGISTSVNYVPLFAALRIHVRGCKDLKNLETVGDVDPYVRVMLNGRQRYQTLIHPDTLEPTFEESFYVPISTEKSHLSFDVMDAEKTSKDRSLGSHTVDLSKIVNKTEEGYWIPYDGSKEIIVGALQMHNKRPKGKISYSISFLPTMPVYSPTELRELEIENEKHAELVEEEKKEQERLKEIYDKNPKDWEWYEVDEEEERYGPEKMILPLEELVKHQSGVLGMHFMKAQVTKTDAYVQILFDEMACAAFISSRAKGTTINIPDTEDAFIRDLPNSCMILRITKKEKINSEDDIVAEQKYSVLDLLQKGYNHDFTLDVQGNKITMKFEYIPSAVELPATETMLDVGTVHLKILDGISLAAADSNGKSDPFAVIKVNDTVIYKTSKKKRTLDPIWGEECSFPVFSRSRSQVWVEVFDWDVAGSNDFLGKGLIGLSNLQPGEETEFKVNLDTEGAVHFIASFEPSYVRPKIEKFGRGGAVGEITGAPLKIAGAGIGAVGAIGGGVAKTGGSLVKGIFGGKKKRREIENDLPSLNGDESFVRESMESSRVESESETTVDNSGFIQDSFVKRNQNDDLLPPPIVGTGVHSPYSSDLQSLRSGRQQKSTSPSTPNSSKDHKTHKRTSSSISRASTQTEDADVIPGRLSVLSLNGILSKHPVQVKITLNKDTTDETESIKSGKEKKHKNKEIYKTRSTKSKEGIINYNESSAFKASPSSAMTFHIVEHHTFGKHVDVGKATIKLNDILGKTDEISIPLEIPQEVDVATLDLTSIVLSFNYQSSN